MRGPSKALPKYRHHRASGKAVVTLDGSDFYLGKHGTKASKAQYKRLIGEWLANGRRMPHVSNDHPIAVVQLCAEYLRFCQTYYVKNGKPRRVKKVSRLIRVTKLGVFALGQDRISVEVARR